MAVNNSSIHLVVSKFMQQLSENWSLQWIQMIAFSNCNPILFCCLVFTAVMKENVLSTIALLTGFVRQLRAYVANYLYGLSPREVRKWTIRDQNATVVSGMVPLKIGSSFQWQWTIFLYCSSIALLFSSHKGESSNWLNETLAVGSRWMLLHLSYSFQTKV